MSWATEARALLECGGSCKLLSQLQQCEPILASPEKEGELDLFFILV